MKKNQILALLLAAVMLLAVLTGCAAKTEPAQSSVTASVRTIFFMLGSPSSWVVTLLGLRVRRF